MMQLLKQNKHKSEQLVEGIPHIYSNKNLTFAELREIIKLAAKGQLEQVTEKIDGSNLLFTCNELGELRIARSNKDMLNGGLLPQDIYERYTKFIHVRDAFINAFNILKSALTMISPFDKQIIFNGGQKYYSIEVVYHNADHVINYDGNHIIFHAYPIYQIKNRTISSIDTTNIELLKQHIDIMQSVITQKNWKLHEPCFVSMKNIANGTVLANVLHKLDGLLNEYNLNDNNTIKDYIRARAKDFAQKQHIPQDVIDVLVERMINTPGAKNVVQLKRLAKRFDEEIEELLTKETSQKLLLPLEIVISEFATQILKTITPTLQSDISNTKEKLHKIIKQLRNNDYIADSFMFKNHMAKVGNIDEMIPIEGIVFLYKNKHYKFTGQFASANQLINIFRKTLQKEQEI